MDASAAFLFKGKGEKTKRSTSKAFASRRSNAQRPTPNAEVPECGELNRTESGRNQRIVNGVE
jgi:hypothetical protein